MSLLISQRIAKSPTFLNSPAFSQDELFDLRLRVVRATKVIVGHELLNSETNMVPVRERLYGKDGQHAAKREKLYAQYCKMPFAAMFIENDTGSLLIEALPGGSIRAQYITPFGTVIPYCTYMEPTAEGTVRWHVGYPKRLNPDDELVEKFKSCCRNDLTFTLETLLFLNAQNAVTHRYTPTRRENAAVPKPLQVHYTYHVLDVFREKKHYDSLAEVMDFLSTTAGIERRAHIVRGHFKQTKTGLFWWSSFVRCRKNLESQGFADKDYRLVA